MIRAMVAALAVVMPCVSGCGGSSGRPDLVKVQGTVTFKGSPVEGATVTFFAVKSDKSSRNANGTTDSSGRFKLTTYDTNDGVIPGEHSVSIAKVATAGQGTALTQENMKEKMAKDMQMMAGGKMSEIKVEQQLPAKYADAKTSKEVRTVVKGESHDFKFDLE